MGVEPELQSISYHTVLTYCLSVKVFRTEMLQKFKQALQTALETSCSKHCSLLSISLCSSLPLDTCSQEIKIKIELKGEAASTFSTQTLHFLSYWILPWLAFCQIQKKTQVLILCNQTWVEDLGSPKSPILEFPGREARCKGRKALYKWGHLPQALWSPQLMVFVIESPRHMPPCFGSALPKMKVGQRDEWAQDFCKVTAGSGSREAQNQGHTRTKAKPSFRSGFSLRRWIPSPKMKLEISLVQVGLDSNPFLTPEVTSKPTSHPNGTQKLSGPPTHIHNSSPLVLRLIQDLFLWNYVFKFLKPFLYSRGLLIYLEEKLQDSELGDQFEPCSAFSEVQISFLATWASCLFNLSGPDPSPWM